jgi:adenine-specific DNA-methyltransferase
MPTLDWLNRTAAFTTAARVPYRLLEQVSVHTATAATPSPLWGEGRGEGPHDNLLIQGDNLEALKALLPFYRGQVKCIFIDPPYNTKSAFEHYDDNLEHAHRRGQNADGGACGQRAGAGVVRYRCARGRRRIQGGSLAE